MKWVMVFTISSMLFLGCNRWWITSPSPIEFVETFDDMTKSKLYTKLNAEKAIERNECSVIEYREYYSGVKLHHFGDMKSAAIGVDDWVSLDGGNSFSLEKYVWIPAGLSGFEGSH